MSAIDPIKMVPNLAGVGSFFLRGQLDDKLRAFILDSLHG